MKNSAIDFDGTIIMSAHIVNIGPIIKRESKNNIEYFYQISLSHGSVYEYINSIEANTITHRNNLITAIKD